MLLSKKLLGTRHFFRELGRAGVPPEEFERLRLVRWRLKNGLEHRALVALLAAPSARERARAVLRVSDFLTPAYAALAAVVLRKPEDAEQLESARSAAIDGRVYVPQLTPQEWESEAMSLLGLLLARRERWSAHSSALLKRRQDSGTTDPASAPRHFGGALS
jgi:hypothetical protein